MDEVLFVLELIGAAAFAVSGAMAAIEKRADIFGVLFLAVTTALGGGVIRDVLIGRIPPVMFVSYWYLLISVAAALAVFIDAYLRSEKYKLHLDKLDAVNNIFDAIGLAVFTVSGMNAAMPVSDNIILVLFVGMCTGVGGGMLRDVMTNTMPRCSESVCTRLRRCSAAGCTTQCTRLAQTSWRPSAAECCLFLHCAYLQRSISGISRR